MKEIELKPVGKIESYKLLQSVTEVSDDPMYGTKVSSTEFSLQTETGEVLLEISRYEENEDSWASIKWDYSATVPEILGEIETMFLAAENLSEKTIKPFADIPVLKDGARKAETFDEVERPISKDSIERLGVDFASLPWFRINSDGLAGDYYIGITNDKGIGLIVNCKALLPLKDQIGQFIHSTGKKLSKDVASQMVETVLSGQLQNISGEN